MRLLHTGGFMATIRRRCYWSLLPRTSYCAVLPFSPCRRTSRWTRP
jgi:hypothetical protein